MAIFEAARLPDSAKESLCRGLLEEFGADPIHVRDDELIHGCLLPTGNHKDQARNPTASLNFKKLTYKCLSAETLVKTFDGEREIGSLAGQTALLLDGNGKWVEAPVKRYGTERLYRVTLSRNGVRQEVYATADHRWYTRPKGASSGLVEGATLDLKPRQRIPSVWTMTRTGRTTISPTGVMAGFVYGDGTSTEHGSRANFVGDKDAAMLPYFAAHEVKRYGDKAMVLTGLPRSWKDLPDLDEGVSYLYGWLAGYFAADGCVAEDGHVTLACANQDTLRFVVALCDRLGIATYTLSGRSRVGRSGQHEAPNATDIYSLSFRGSTLTAEFFLLPHHRSRYESAQQRRTYERTHWWVVSVEATDRVEDVFCAEVTTTSSFVLAGNILTGNCLGCGSGGGLLWFIASCRNATSQEARAWLEGATGLGNSPMPMQALLDLLDALYAPQREPEPIPTYSERVLAPWAWLHPYMTEIRHVPEQTLLRFKVGYAEAYEWQPGLYSERIVIPHFWQQRLVGWQTRRLLDTDGSPKYQSSPAFPKDRSLYNYDPAGKTAVVVESPLSVLRHVHHQPFVGTFGASITVTQTRLLQKYARIVLFLDNDKAGWDAMFDLVDNRGRVQRTGLINALSPCCKVYVVQNPYEADPADMSDDLVDELVDSAIPWSVYRRPQELRVLEEVNG